MPSLKIRPEFKKLTQLNSDEIFNRISKYAESIDRKSDVTLLNDHAIFYIKTEQQHFWSPQLSLDVKEKDEKTFLVGMYGPSPKVWTMFMFFYMGAGIIGLFSLLFGLVQWSLNMNPYGLWVALTAIILEVIFYFVAQTGKQLAEKQMIHLDNEINSLLN